MGTAVLSPQDCFVSPHGRHDLRFKDVMHPSTPKTPKSARNALQTAAVQSGIPSVASDRARRDSYGAACNAASEMDVLNGFNDSSGLLPVPVTGFDSRHSSLTGLSLTSFSGRTCSTVSSRSRRLAAPPAISSPVSRIATSAAPTSCSKSTRSVSAGLLAFRGSQASAAGEVGHGRQIPSSDGVPFKTSKNNRMVDRVSYELETASRRDLQSKFLDSKRGFHEKRIVGCECAGDLRKRTHADFACQQGLLEREALVSSRNVSPEECGGTNWLRRYVEGKKGGKRRETDRGGLSGKEIHEKDAVRTQAVTILQRPKDKDAAVELIARFFKIVEADASLKKGVDLETQIEELKSDRPIQSKANAHSVSNEHSEVNFSKRTLRNEGLHGVPEAENDPQYPKRLAVCGEHLTMQNRDSSYRKVLVRQGSVDSQRTSCYLQTEVSDVALGEIKMEEDEGFGEISKYIASWLPMFCDEPWAGPAFTNSPPPSSLPLPKFPMKPFRTTPTKSSCIRNQSVAGTPLHPSDGVSLVSISPSMLPSRRSVSFNGRSSGNEQEGACDIAFATKDLRRMLNLDAC